MAEAIGDIKQITLPVSSGTSAGTYDIVDDGAVRYDNKEQSLTDSQKAKARSNIGAAATVHNHTSGTTVSGSGNAVVNINGLGATVDYAYIDVNGGSNNARPLVLQSGNKGTGNVGIGVTQPTDKLEVGGNINATGTIKQNGTAVSLSGHTHTKSDITDLGTIGAAAAKSVDSSITASSTSTNLPTSGAVASFVEGKGYTTNTGTVTTTGTMTANHVVVSNGTTVIKDSGFTIGKSVPSDAKFTDTTYESKSAASDGTAVSLVTTGEKYTWNNKSNFSGSYTDLTNKPDIPTVNNGALTVVAGTTASGTFTANQSGNSTITIDATTHKELSDAIAALPSPMVFKGSLGTGGTITSLPSASSSNEGFTYKVITDGTYASQAAKIGDMFISNGSSWVLVPSGDEPSGTVTSVGITSSDDDIVNLSISGSPITSSGTITVSGSHAASGATAGSYGDSANQTPAYGGTFKVPYVTVNATGHVTGISAHTVKIPASDNTNQTVKVGSTTFGASDAVEIVAGSNVTVTPDSTNKKITIASTNTNTTYSLTQDATDGHKITLTPSSGTAQTITIPDNNTTYTAGTGLTLSGTQFKHSNSVTAGTASEGGSARTLAFGGTFNVPSVTYDAQGHVTGKGSTTLTMPANPNTNQTVKGNGTAFGASDAVDIVAGSNVTVTADATNKTITIAATDTNTHNSHAIISGVKADGTTNIQGTASSGNITMGDSGVTAGEYGPTANQTPSYGSTFNVPDIKVNAKGIVTSVVNRTVKIPASDNTDTKVTQSLSTANGDYPVILKNNTTATDSPTSTTNYAAAVKVNPSTGNLTVTKINGVAVGSSPKFTDTTYSVATSSANGLMSSTDKTKLDEMAMVTYGTCSTAAATAAKVVTISNTNWELKVGSIIGVRFTNSNTASNVTLNVNSTGAKSIYYSNAVYTSTGTTYTGYANRTIYYMYDGTYWVWLNAGWSLNSDTIPSGYCTTAAATAAKTASFTYWAATAKSFLQINFRYANSSASALTLNINGTGAKPIYINGSASSASNYTLPAGSYIAYYNGTNFYLRTDGKLTADITGTASKVGTAVTFNNGGSGAASGTTFDGSAARTVSYNTVGAAASSHAHGNITSGGDITTTATIASGDRLVINDESASKVTNSSITFGSSTTQVLANNGTWVNLPSGGTQIVVSSTQPSGLSNRSFWYEVIS